MYMSWFCRREDPNAGVNVQKFFIKQQKSKNKHSKMTTDQNKGKHDDKTNQQTERKRQDLNTQRDKRKAGAGNQGDEQEGSEVNSDENNTNLPNKTGNNRQQTEGTRTQNKSQNSRRK